MHLGEGYFELRAGPFRLGLPTHAVLSVMEGPTESDGEVTFRERSVRCIDLRTLLTERVFDSPPALAAVIETGAPGARGSLALGVDWVGTVPITHTAPLAHIPGFGLRHPELFQGALRWEGRLVLALNLDGLERLVA
jgi:hypothetical protein